MVAVQNPSLGSHGALQLIDVEHDTVSNKQNTVHDYTIHGYNGSLPVTIQDFPGASVAYVYGSGDGSFTPADTATDAVGTPVGGLPGFSSSIYISADLKFVYAGNPNVNGGNLTVIREQDGYLTLIPEAAISKLALSPGGQTLLFFTANANSNSNNVYQLVGIGQNSVFDCDQQILLNNPGNQFLPYDKPINALYSSDGTNAFILNCGPECGGTTASITILSTADLLNAASAAYTGKTGCNIPSPNTISPAVLTPTATIAVPGGVTTALQAGNTLFVAGQQLQSSGYYGGVLTIIDLTTDQITGTYTIGDGTHFRMRLGDNNDSLWIAAKTCGDGVQAATGGITGCMTLVPLTAAANGGYTTTQASIVIEPNHGDAGGMAPIIGYDKTYTVEGSAVYIYSNVDGSAINNYYVQVYGTPVDIAFIDGNTNTGP